MTRLTRQQLEENIRAMQSQGAPDDHIQQYINSVQISDNQPQQTQQPQEREGAGKRFLRGAKKFGEGVIRSEKAFAESIAGAMLTDTTGGKILRSITPGGKKAFEAVQGAKQAREDLYKQQQDILLRIKGARSRGEDTTNLMRALEFNRQAIEDAPSDFDLNSLLGKTKKQVIGEAAGVAVDIISAGQFGKTANIGATTFKEGFKQGAKQGAKAGLLEGAAGGFARGLQDDESIKDSAGRAVQEGIVGAAAGGVLGGLVGGVQGGLKGRQLQRQEARALLGEGELPEVADSPIIRKAEKEGIQNKTAKFIRDMDPNDKALAREQFKIGLEASKDQAVTSRPSDVAGRSLLKRTEFIKTARKEAGENLAKVVDEFPDEAIDYSDQANNFFESLRRSGVQTGTGKNGEFVLDFTESRYANNPAVQKKVNQAVSMLSPDANGAVSMTPRKTVTLRQTIFDDLDLAKKGAGDIPDSATAILERLRKDLDQPLQEFSPDYAKYSETYAKASQALRDFRRLTGKNFDASSEFAARQAGEKIRRVLGNNSGVTLDMLESIDSITSDLGGEFGDDIVTQATFAQITEDLFGLRGPTTLESSVSRGVGAGDTIGNAAADASRGNIAGAIQRFFKKSADPAKQQQIIADMIGAGGDNAVFKLDTLTDIRNSLPFEGFDPNMVMSNPDMLKGRVDDIANKIDELGLRTPFLAEVKRKGANTLAELIEIAEDLIIR